MIHAACIKKGVGMIHLDMAFARGEKLHDPEYRIVILSVHARVVNITEKKCPKDEVSLYIP